MNHPDVILIAPGAFDPITYLHLRMFELARDHFKNSKIMMLLSPVHADYTAKRSMQSTSDRLKMCSLALESTDIVLDDWEATQTEYKSTLTLLKRLKRKYSSSKIMLLCGADLVASFQDPSAHWPKEDVDEILRDFGCFIVRRGNVDVEALFSESGMNITNSVIVREIVENNVSSSLIRDLLKQGKSVKWLIPDKVIDWIEKNNLYRD